MAKTCAFKKKNGLRCGKPCGRKHGGYGPLCRPHYVYVKGRLRVAGWGAGGYAAMQVLDFISQKGLENLWLHVFGKGRAARSGGRATSVQMQARPRAQMRSRSVVRMAKRR